MRHSQNRATLWLTVLLFVAHTSIVPGQLPVDQEAAFAKWVKTPPKKTRGSYFSTLERLGLSSKESVALFASRVTADDIAVRRAAARGLALIGQLNPEIATPVLIKAAKDSDSVVRRHAVFGLGEIDPPSLASIVAITEVLENDEWNSYVAARALGKFGVKARPAVDSLAKALSHQEDLTRSSAADALGNIGPEAWSAAPALRVACRDEDADVRVEAAYALWRIDKSPDAITALVPLLESNESLTVLRAIEVLGEVGPPATAALPGLEKVRQDVDERHDRMNASASIWAIGRIRGSNDLFERLIRELDNPNARARVGAAWGLGKIGPDARAALPRLLKELEENAVDYGYGIYHIAEAVARIEPVVGDR